jgi:hypothetical protein
MVAARPRGPRERAVGWCNAGAVLLGVWALTELIRWGNRWYVTEMLARSVTPGDDAAWPWLYVKLHSAMDALVLGLVLAVLAVGLAVLGAFLRRSGRGAVPSVPPAP